MHANHASAQEEPQVSTQNSTQVKDDCDVHMLEDMLCAVQTVAREGGHPGLVDDADALEKELDNLAESTPAPVSSIPLTHVLLFVTLRARVCNVLQEFCDSEFYCSDNADHQQVGAMCARLRGCEPRD